MYRQILVSDHQRDLQRILWRDSPEQPIDDYVLNTVTYGTSPASFIATRCLHELAILNKTDHAKGSQVIATDFYMDDLITGADTIHETSKIKQEVSSILESAGFQLRKWVSNNLEILNSIKDSENNISQYIITDEACIKTLGIVFKAQDDTLQITSSPQIKLDKKVITKRIILGSIAQIFDPLGLVGPITIKGKVFMQKLWQMQLDWDAPVPSDIHTEWLQFINQSHLLQQLIIPRHIASPNAVEFQIHAFCDASEQAYGTSVYLRTVAENRNVCTRLICAKSRVAPIKCVTLPRLELCGAVLAAQLTNKVIKALKMHISHTYFWTDSTIVLSWLAAPATNWKTFVSNRVAEIQRLTDISNWRHIRSNENPADIISRGCNPEKLLDCPLWWSGPTWLANSPEQWDIKYEFNLDHIPESKSNKLISLVTVTDKTIFNQFSYLTKLVRVVAYCIRFMNNALNKAKNTRKNGSLTSEELQFSLHTLIRAAQASEFAEDISRLKSGNVVSRKSKLLPLKPFLDHEGIVRVGGRISKAIITTDQKFPIVLSNKHPFTKLIILNEHVRNFHAGPQATLAMVHLRYWPLKGRSTVRKVLHGCITCFKAKPSNTQPLMADLPEQRVQVCRPFYNSGVDYAGPFLVKDGRTRSRKLTKCYLCIFVCFSTRAVHFELAGDLSRDSFLNALKRFVSRRGLCKNLHCDNATNFRGASNELKEIQTLLVQYLDDPKVNNYFTANNISWHFIPSRSPHMGGLWEAAVKSAKYHTKRILGDTHLTYEELNTVFAQIEAILNSRPITPLSTEPSDLIPLTPSHFLIGDVLTAIPQLQLTDIPENRLSRYQRLQQLIQHFWKRWKSEYLSTLQQRSKWKVDKSQGIEVGDLVILKEENTPPMHWPMARVIELCPGSDSVVRVVKVKTANGVVKRAVAKVCKLPIEARCTND